MINVNSPLGVCMTSQTHCSNQCLYPLANPTPKGLQSICQELLYNTPQNNFRDKRT